MDSNAVCAKRSAVMMIDVVAVGEASLGEGLKGRSKKRILKGQSTDTS